MGDERSEDNGFDLWSNAILFPRGLFGKGLSEARLRTTAKAVCPPFSAGASVEAQLRGSEQIQRMCSQPCDLCPQIVGTVLPTGDTCQDQVWSLARTSCEAGMYRVLKRAQRTVRMTFFLSGTENEKIMSQIGFFQTNKGTGNTVMRIEEPGIQTEIR